MKKRKAVIRNPRFSRQMAELSVYFLTTADEILCRSGGLDTAVRDNVAEGLATIVRAGHDCAAGNIAFATTDQWMNFIDNATADWFRARGFAEWFCLAAANGFRSGPNRTKIQQITNPTGKNKFGARKKRITTRHPKARRVAR